MPLFSHILAPFDFSQPSEAGVRFARELAEVHNADVTIVHVVQEPTFPSFFKLGALRIYGTVPDPEKLAWRALEKRFGEPDSIERLDYRVAKGEAESQIVRLASSGEFDLVVISSHGLTGLEHVLMGSVAEKVVRHSPVPTLVVKAMAASAELQAGSETARAGAA